VAAVWAQDAAMPSRVVASHAVVKSVVQYVLQIEQIKLRAGANLAAAVGVGARKSAQNHDSKVGFMTNSP
jgi:hypothetical protein